MLHFNVLIVVVLSVILPLCKGQAISKDLYRCRQMCHTKFIQNWHQCMDNQDCRNCWKNCDETLGPFPLNVISASKQGSMVLTDIAWDPTITNTSKQCLVTWEVSGGGLMGNLLTDGSTVELSLWADTVYHIQVTCKRKESNTMRKSLKLIVDTRRLTLGGSSSSSSWKFLPSSTVSSSAFNSNSKKFEDFFLPDSSMRNSQEELKHIFRDSNYPEESMNHISSVIFSKLEIKKRNLTEMMYSKNIVYILFGSLLIGLSLLLGVIIFVLRRSRRRFNLNVDKEELIRNEHYLQNGSILHV